MPLALELISPERLLLAKPVEMVVLPAAEGELGVLPGHAPMIVALRGGLIRIFEHGQETAPFFVTAGFAEITPERCSILATEAIAREALRRDDAEARLKAARAAFETVDKNDPFAREQAMAAVATAETMLRLAAA
jgi:F-type H+-transporting ATPase subunit epsilon